MVQPSAPGVPMQPPAALAPGQDQAALPPPASGRGAPGAKPAQPDSGTASPTSPPGRPSQSSKAVNDLMLWRRIAVNRVRAGRRAKLDPPSGTDLPTETAVALRDRLERAASTDDVRAAFADFLTDAA